MKLFVTLTYSLLILLFSYTAFSKLADVEKFRYALSRSPLLSGSESIVAVLLPLIELFVSGLLYFESSRQKGFQASLILLLAFTIYLVCMLFTNKNLPCTCGGVIQQLNWREHIALNVFFILLTVTALLFHRKNKKI